MRKLFQEVSLATANEQGLIGRTSPLIRKVSKIVWLLASVARIRVHGSDGLADLMRTAPLVRRLELDVKALSDLAREGGEDSTRPLLVRFGEWNSRKREMHVMLMRLAHPR